MEYRHLGRSGLQVSAVGVGTNNFATRLPDLEGARAVVRRALDEGINLFDTADVYGNRGSSEEYLGAALQGEWSRVIVATKFRSKMGDAPNDAGTSRYHLQNAVEASLKRLKTDHIDLYQVHSWDPHTPIEETLRGLDDLVRAGKVRYIGASNFDAWQLSHANDLADFRGWTSFVSIQPHYHMLERQVERELVPYCRYAGVGILPYFPLAGGFLTGKYRRGEPLTGKRTGYVSEYHNEHNLTLVERLGEFAAARGHSMGELAIAWLLGEPQMSSVIAGAMSSEQVSANARAADWKLTPADMAEVRRILEGQPAPAP